jgi:hypothetical protein
MLQRMQNGNAKHAEVGPLQCKACKGAQVHLSLGRPWVVSHAGIMQQPAADAYMSPRVRLLAARLSHKLCDTTKSLHEQCHQLHGGGVGCLAALLACMRLPIPIQSLQLTVALCCCHDAAGELWPS